MFMAYVLLSMLVSYPSLTYNVATSHTEPVVVLTLFVLVRAHVSAHATDSAQTTFAPPFDDSSQGHLEICPSLDPHSWLSFVHLFNSIFSLNSSFSHTLYFLLLYLSSK